MSKEIIEIIPENFTETGAEEALEEKAIFDFLNGISNDGINSVIDKEVKNLLSDEDISFSKMRNK